MRHSFQAIPFFCAVLQDLPFAVEGSSDDCAVSQLFRGIHLGRNVTSTDENVFTGGCHWPRLRSKNSEIISA